MRTCYLCLSLHYRERVNETSLPSSLPATLVGSRYVAKSQHLNLANLIEDMTCFRTFGTHATPTRSYLQHQPDDEDHREAGHDVGMVLDDELMAQKGWILVGRLSSHTRLDGHCVAVFRLSFGLRLLVTGLRSIFSGYRQFLSSQSKHELFRPSYT